MQGEKTFETVEDLHEAMKVVADFCDDLIYGRVFEISSLGQSGESNLFFDDERLREVAKAIVPYLNDEPNLVDTLTAACRTDDDQERVFDLVLETQNAFLTLGILLGARIADPSNESFKKLAAGWIRATLAQPRHEHLTAKAGEDTDAKD